MEENKENKDLEGQEGQEDQEDQSTPEGSRTPETPESDETSEEESPDESTVEEESSEEEVSAIEEDSVTDEPAAASVASEETSSDQEAVEVEEDEEDEEEPNVTVGGIAKKWGLYVALFGIVYFLFQQFAGLAANNVVGYLGSIITIIGIVLAHNEFKREGNGFMSYKQGLGIGTLISVWSSIISSIFAFIYIKFIDDSMLTLIRDQQIQQLEERGMSQEQIDQAMQISSSFTGPVAIMIFGIIGGVLIGFILSLIISAITRNDDPSLEV